MQTFKRKIRAALYEAGWELEEIREEVDWFATEHWRVVSVRENWGSELFLTFLVDPQWTRDKRAGVWAVSACGEQPTERLHAEQGRVLSLNKGGRFDERLRGFVQQLVEDRRNPRVD